MKKSKSIKYITNNYIQNMIKGIKYVIINNLFDENINSYYFFFTLKIQKCTLRKFLLQLACSTLFNDFYDFLVFLKVLMQHDISTKISL